MAVPKGRLTSGDRGTRRVISLRGSRELQARLDNVALSFFDIATHWQREAIAVARPRIPARTGATRRSLRAVPVGAKTKNARGGRAALLQARVEGSYIGYFVDRGVKPHEIAPRRKKALRWEGGQGTIFASRANHPGYRRRPFRARMAREGLRRTPMAEALVKRWNEGA